ncbi:MAG: glycosyltransferase family 4 protein [Sedimentisphaerales bacterium]|nr:glycosyltransferase family 4 protein [Sedimentisphaerales bacterium]
MRICFLSHGQFVHIGAYLDYFDNAGHDVHFISLTPGPARNVPTYNTGFGSNYSTTSGKWKYPLSMLRVRRLVRQLKPDVLHAHYATSGGLASLFTGFHPTIVTVHGTDLTSGRKSIIWRPLLKRIFENADCVNTVSEGLTNMVLELGIPPGKLRTLSLGIDTDRFSLSGNRSICKDRTLRLVCTRRMERHYGHHTIIEALAILKQAGVDFHVTLLGDGSSQPDLKAQVANAELGEYVTFLGEIENQRLPEILHEHDVYLSASWWDGTSLSLLEAMATGIFPIVSDIEANSSWLKHGVNGLLHKVDDARGLADCIIQLVDKPRIAAAAAEQNRQLVVAGADRKTSMKRLASIYQDLVSATQNDT